MKTETRKLYQAGYSSGSWWGACGYGLSIEEDRKNLKENSDKELLKVFGEVSQELHDSLFGNLRYIEQDSIEQYCPDRGWH